MTEPPINLAAYRKRRTRQQRRGPLAWLRNWRTRRQPTTTHAPGTCVRCGHALAKEASWCQHCGVHYTRPESADDLDDARPAWVNKVAVLVLIGLIAMVLLPLLASV
ncbi:hypothetical protein [Andreprevotia sp. IGB-42]|uniref:hypothetical protein n=1 Tax=Andreprevotia sp. IGB-42 TaxID=2497473 RepID=UPI00135BB8AF|nr:hypothetical protein [Andreprevotia sp. IGB-42]